ncbi:CRISPR-associated helicase Cas3' [candidate division KSB1 bacterium]|nr:CRISPR-associated helicase Cas3' [candidate division KSB1 bacterium]
MNNNQALQPLLAKSKRNGRIVTLEEHSCDTAKAAELIFNLEKRWGRNWCRFFRIAAVDRERFLLNLRVAALLHDLGKANEDFYRAVTNFAAPPQTLRHEHISALILFLPEVRNWLAQNSALDLDVITAAVLSHHLKASAATEAEKYGWCAPRGKTTLSLFLQHAEVKAVLQKIREVAQIEQNIPELPLKAWGEHSPYLEATKAGREAANKFRRTIKKQPERLSFLLAIKAGVIAADSASSGLWREGHSIEDWVNRVVHTTPITQTALVDAILNPRAAQISQRRKEPFTYKDFQKLTATKGPRVLLLAACAAGKTLAAWKWAEAQVSQYEIGKVIFLYPTRGTATEGFRDYVGWAPEDEAMLDHGTAGYELEAMQENTVNNLNEALKGKTLGLSEAEERLYALGLWGRRYFSATVDQFLGFMEHQYNSMCKLPMLADCALIIDEVHSFDRKMFNTLVAFLKKFDLPVLCMTATLPPHRQKELEAAGLKLYPASDDATLKKQEEHPRYRLQPVADENAAFAKAVAAYREGQRVLWVVNTVARCQSLADRLADELKVGVLSYHSRFKLVHRQKVHKKTVAAFQQEGAPAIAVTTQVCEMSLDLDADVLLTEFAPVPSLVQRFGRANRHLKRQFAVLHTYKPENDKPYFKDDIEMALKFLNAIGAKDVSQAELAKLLETHSIAEPAGDDSASFLESGYFATPGEFRDIDEFALPCILDDEVEIVIALNKNKQSYDGFVVNVPKGFIDLKAERPAGLPKHLFVADHRRYNEHRGFLSE